MVAALPYAYKPSIKLITDELAVHAPLTVRHTQQQDLSDLVIPVGIFNPSWQPAGQALQRFISCWQTIVIVILKVALHRKQHFEGVTSMYISRSAPGTGCEVVNSHKAYTTYLR